MLYVLMSRWRLSQYCCYSRDPGKLTRCACMTSWPNVLSQNHNDIPHACAIFLIHVVCCLNTIPVNANVIIRWPQNVTFELTLSPVPADLELFYFIGFGINMQPHLTSWAVSNVTSRIAHCPITTIDILIKVYTYGNNQHKSLLSHDAWYGHEFGGDFEDISLTSWQ
jgi:hypothetical protein